MSYVVVIEFISRAVEVLGVCIIVFGILTSSALYISQWYEERKNAYQVLRQNISRAILLGLEFLVAGDIIRSVAVSPSFTSVGILGLIVLIRSFLSIELEKEVEGVWPWQKKPRGGPML